ncbi:hypothetical protein CEY12_05625 [Chryseobacterium sp. T16E-39]|uniref:hypothetical protein n=1 Tax=Chryseobacterium sp. T16E-39 TaxID=2015076 RepID=UPI000B5B31E5|nr:hypothetical protein [Chryseobacterium sp. T16E-39]ASK29614.1 hypothetical protein CEY12_05625 [Chryseobacterium sp. T16E-39]
MKYFSFLVFIFFFSCSKTVEDRCFIEGDKTGEYIEKKPYTVKQILKEKPKYLTIINLKKYRSFKQDSIDSSLFNSISREEFERRFKAKEREFENFTKKISEQFSYFSKQEIGRIQYALAKNNMGYWLLKIENNQPSAYFLGLSFSHYYFNKTQKEPIVKDGFFQAEGSLVKIVKMDGLPGYDDYTPIEEGKLFKINLNDLTKDSDHDGYNDIFEESFGLNPTNRDTDGDGINDFDDLNPMYKTEKNKFTQLYELLLPSYGIEDLREEHYSFNVYSSDCDYFHQINPEFRVLFVPEEESKQTAYVRVTDVFRGGISKIKKDKKDLNKVYITEWGNSSSSKYSAEYLNGKWTLNVIGGYII